MIQHLLSRENFLNLSSGEVVQTPNVIRVTVNEHIINQYLQCCNMSRRHPLSRITLKVDFHCRVKKHARKQFLLVRKIILLGCLFYVPLCAFSPYKLCGPWVENKKGRNLICAARKNGGSSEQAFAPSFLPLLEAKEKGKIQKLLDKGYISKPFPTCRIPYASERNVQK